MAETKVATPTTVKAKGKKQEVVKPKRTKFSTIQFTDDAEHLYISDREQKSKELFADIDGRFSKINTPALRLNAESYLTAMGLERGAFQSLMKGNSKYLVQFDNGALYILDTDRQK